MRVSHLGMPTLTAKIGWLAGVGTAIALSGCANQTVQHYSHGHEYFSQAKYGRASQKVVADGQPVPKGGGQYLVGHPYSIAGHTYYPKEVTSYSAVGMASWYGAAFHGRRTANGEVYDMASITAAHPTMPLPSYARVTNLSNGYSVIVRVNDRGPYHGGRVMDVSSRTADVLGFKGEGTAKIKVEYVGSAPMEGSDDNALLASLRTDGSPANLNGYSAPTMIAGASDAGPSVFAALFGSGRSAPQSVPQPAPEPEPIRVAAAQPVRVAVAEPAPTPEPPPTPEPKPGRMTPPAAIAMHRSGPVPLPPPRPFDLGTIRASTVVAIRPPLKPAAAPLAVLPPRRPLVQASAERALYFSEFSEGLVKRLPARAFDRLRAADSTTWE